MNEDESVPVETIAEPEAATVVVSPEVAEDLQETAEEIEEELSAVGQQILAALDAFRAQLLDMETRFNAHVSTEHSQPDEATPPAVEVEDAPIGEPEPVPEPEPEPEPEQPPRGLGLWYKPIGRRRGG